MEWLLFCVCLCVLQQRSFSFIFPDKLHLETSDVLNQNCGHSTFELSFRPKEGRRNENPWLVLLRHPDENFHFCHGTLITDRFVLSTAACGTIIELHESLVILGEHNTRTDPDCYGTNDCAPAVVKRVIDNVYFPDGVRMDDQESFAKDLALFRLDRAVEFSSAIAPICIPLARLHIDAISFDSIYHTLWTTLQRVPVQYWEKVLEMNDCQRRVGDDMIVHDGQLCTTIISNIKFDTEAASGSPLQVDFHGHVFQLGIMSLGMVNGTAETPLIFVDVSKHSNWIHNTVDRNQN